MDTDATVAIITAIGAVVISVTTLILAHLRDIKNSETLGRVEKTGTETHALVNSASLATERLLAVALRKIADDDPMDKDKRLAAEAMEKQVKEHEERQKVVDRNQ